MSASFFQLRLALLLLLRLSEGAGGGAGGLRRASLLQFSSVTAQLDGEPSASPLTYLNSTCRSSDSRPSILVLRLGAALLPFSEHSNNDTKQLTSC